ncbi:DUF6119 family protein [Herbiconiux ginsengi]|uniref:Sporadically distributed protein, TIGR04141 family n=1 Tax=Herbiconiux ginsengi TaxID=381665 RepID=A0A1H3QR16_9MICO|nr:DUF6119 family protein [Herbiconiux ginsengi]SDZ15866.1 sporadically distributed protein, TIGR04141 family [Herbiconiux ginsengi]
MASRRLTIYLLRDIDTVDDALASDKSPHSAELDADSGLVGRFFYESKPEVSPSWVSFVSPALQDKPESLTSSSASGLLVLQVDNKFLAFTFGYGRSFLDPAKIEHQFGLRVALNRIDASQIRSLDTKTFEDMVVTRTTQASKSSELPTFGVDVSRDILRAVTGEPRDKSIAKRLSGSDALVVNLVAVASELPDICREFLAAYEEDSYKANFEWIDHLALVTDATIIEQLDGLLVQQLIESDTSSTHFAMPEALSWEDVDAFKIAGTRSTEYDDLEIDAYLNALGDARVDLTIEALKQRHVSVRFSRSTTFESRWTVYQCLVTEQRIDLQLYVLIEGRWFVVSESLVDEVDTFANSLGASPTVFPDAVSGEAERLFNERTADSAPDDRLLLDARIVRPGGAASGIEVCDILTSSGEFIHVKRKSRSSTLSHLFAQGSVSAATFIGDGTFRDKVRTHIVENTSEPLTSRWLALIPGSADPIDRSAYSVSYVVLANSAADGTNWLPFFSKLNLMQHGRQLKNMNLDVTITRVPVV